MSFLNSIKTLFGLAPTQSDSSNRTETVAGNEPPPSPPAAKPAPAGLPPATQRRDKVLRFIVEKLRIYQNEPDTAPIGVRLCIVSAGPEDEELYRVALWANQAGRFRHELDRLLADNYIQLPDDWRFEYAFFSDELPAGCSYRDANLGLIVLDDSKPDGPPRLARIVALAGQTEQAEYPLDPTRKTTFCIGRGRTAQAPSGRIRTNDIVILNEDDPGFDPQRGGGNGAVSRSHATIRYDGVQRRYSLLVDAGGLPASGNKTKLIHSDDQVERADIPGMGYPLEDGDQIELGGGVTLLFELVNGK